MNISWEERFWSKVDKTETCWLWTTRLTKKGAGQFSHAGGSKPAHRISYALHYGRIPHGATVQQKCDNRHCVRPDHLEAVGESPAPFHAAVRLAEWKDRALCANYDPDWWSGDGKEKVAPGNREAMKICASCPVSTACLQEALDIGEDYGIRAGKFPKDWRLAS